VHEPKIEISINTQKGRQAGSGGLAKVPKNHKFNWKIYCHRTKNGMGVLRWWTQNCSFHPRRLSIMSIYRCYCCCCSNVAAGHKNFDISNATLTTPPAATKTLNKNWYSHETQATFDKNTNVSMAQS